jgi:hypothetical protein
MRSRVGLLLSLLLILVLAAPSLIMVKPTSAQTPLSPPEFTLSIVDHSYDVAPIYSTDPYTGKTNTVNDGYHVEKRFIEVKIKNQNPTPYSPYTVANQGVNKVYYNIRAKGHFDAWTGNEPNSQSNLAPSDSEYTTVEFGFGKDNPGGFSIWLGDIAPGGQVDFQVEAFTGYYQTIKKNVSDIGCWRIEENSVFTETGRSGWSNTQTITIDALSTVAPETSPSSSTNPSIEPSQSLGPSNSPSPTISSSPQNNEPPSQETNLPIITVGIVAVAILTIVAVAILLKKIHRMPNN